MDSPRYCQLAVCWRQTHRRVSAVSASSRPRVSVWRQGVGRSICVKSMPG